MSVNPSETPDRPTALPEASAHRQRQLSGSALPLLPWLTCDCGVINLPPEFPAVPSPKFALGAQCRSVAGECSDVGVVIGQAFAPDERCDPVQWSWVYLILLTPNSASWGWIVADWADEADLEPLTQGGCQ